MILVYFRIEVFSLDVSLKVAWFWMGRNEAKQKWKLLIFLKWYKYLNFFFFFLEFIGTVCTKFVIVISFYDDRLGIDIVGFLKRKLQRIPEWVAVLFYTRFMGKKILSLPLTCSCTFGARFNLFQLKTNPKNEFKVFFLLQLFF